MIALKLVFNNFAEIFSKSLNAAYLLYVGKGFFGGVFPFGNYVVMIMYSVRVSNNHFEKLMLIEVLWPIAVLN